MTKETKAQRKLAFIVIIVLGIAVLLTRDDPKREPYWDKIKEYQPTIKPEMIMGIVPDEQYSGTPIVDWKLDELVLAMASNSNGLGSSRIMHDIGIITITMDTMDTGIDPNVRLVLSYADGERFFVSFRLTIMKDGEPYASRTFFNEALNEWTRSVGIADKDNW